MMENAARMIRTEGQRRPQVMRDTFLITPDIVRSWRTPDCQRPLRDNQRVRDIGQELHANGGVLSGVITLGKLNGKYYVIDGQHRLLAFLLSELAEGYVEVRILCFETEAEMGREFVELNSHIAPMKADDILRGL
jgi:hypothetical protein